MTPEERTILEGFEQIREHSSPLVLPLLLSLERMWQHDRELLTLARLQVALLSGGSLLDNDRHSRKAGLRSVQ